MAEDTDRAQNSSTSPARNWLAIYLKGVFMGAADTVPGVSGGTIALITGIYERLVTAIAAVDIQLLRDVTGYGARDGRLPLRAAARKLDLVFLCVLGLGIVTAILTVSGLLSVSLARFRGPTNAFFFGLIAASAVVLYSEVSLDTTRRRITAIVAAGFAFWLTGATAADGIPHGLGIVFLSGIVASSAMLLPGISGAAMLYVLGQYEYMIGTLHGLLRTLGQFLGGGNLATTIKQGTIVSTFLIGVALGLMTIARAVRLALRRDRETTLTALVSLMVGALRLPVEEILADTAVWSLQAVGGIVVAGAVGIGLVLILDGYTDDLDYEI